MEALSIICGGLGATEEDDHGNIIAYSKAQFCLDNLKDLLRYLRRDDPHSRQVFNQVCKWNTVGNDLLPIIQFCQHDLTLLLNSVKVLVFLTMPIEPHSNDISHQIENLWAIKSAFTHSVSVPVIMGLLETPLENLQNESFTDDDWKLVQLVLTLFRNILAIQNIPIQEKAGGSATLFLSLRDKFIELLFEENVMEVILVLTQHVGASTSHLRQDNLLLLEIYHYIFKGQDPELVAKAHLKTSGVDESSETSINNLRCIMEEEKETRKLIRLRSMGFVSHLSGSFTRVTLDGSKTLCQGNPCSVSNDAPTKVKKETRGPSKRMLWDQGMLPTTKKKIIESLHDFLNNFLSGGYNDLMESIRENIEREHHAMQESDVVIFFEVAWFATSFQYYKVLNIRPCIEGDDAETSTNNKNDKTLFKGSICGPVADSLNDSMFLLVISKWRYAFDALKETNDYKLLSASGSLLKTMIRMLDLVLKQAGEDSKEPKTARILLYKLFYDQTEEGMTQFLFNMIKSFNKQKQARSDLADMVESIHVIIRLMENLQKRGTLRVSKKSKKKQVRRKGYDKKCGDDEVAADNGATQKEGGSSGHEESVKMNMIKTEKVTNQSSVQQKGGETTISVGMENLETEGAVMVENSCGDTGDNLGPEVDHSSGDEQPAVKEVDLKVSAMISSLANHTIIKNLCWLLKFYKSNSVSTNHYIICMLQRICEDLDLSPMLYQLSLLCTFYDILDEQKLKPSKKYENIVSFLTTLTRRMLRKMKGNPLLFVEVLFWKTQNECRYINCESLVHELGGLRQGSGRSTSSHMNADVGSSGGQGWVRRSIADALGDDEADFVVSHESDIMKENNFKTNHATTGGEEVPNSVLMEGMNGDKHFNMEQHSIRLQSKRVRTKRNSLVLNDELKGKINTLYERFKDDQQCCYLIAQALDENGNISAVQISRTLKKLGCNIPHKARTTIIRNADDRSGDKLSSLNDSGGNNLPRKPLHTRKRVRAFSEDQEQKIKDLFEQFKDHKKCSYMIASELDAEGTFSAVQITRKLKQLGLHVPKKKKSDANFHLRDEPMSDTSIKSPENSDDEPLISLQRRERILLSGAKTELKSLKTKMNLLQDDSDDELISSMLVKTNKSNKKLKVKPYSDETNTRENDLSYGDAQDFGRDKDNNVDGMEDTTGAATSNSGNAEYVGPETSSISDTEVAPSTEPDAFQYQTLEDDLPGELADLRNEDALIVPNNVSVSRRKLRMIMDVDDEE
ncbi:hypothetical protein Leryth_025341 [Lithospermum erythrorhizon]|nr:hypothetical protein Leryth_025341 [Lithospermum erythrorhizon]